MATPIATAYVEVEVNTDDVNRQLNSVKRNTEQMTRSMVKVGREISNILRVTIAAAAGVATLSFKKLLDSQTAAGAAARKQWGDATKSLNTALARIGGFVMNSQIFGKNITGWITSFANALNKLSQQDIQRYIEFFSKLAALWAVIKFGTITIRLGSDVAKFFSRAGATFGGDVAGSALGSAAGVGAVAGISALGKGAIPAAGNIWKSSFSEAKIQNNIARGLSESQARMFSSVSSQAAIGAGAANILPHVSNFAKMAKFGLAAAAIALFVNSLSSINDSLKGSAPRFAGGLKDVGDKLMALANGIGDVFLNPGMFGKILGRKIYQATHGESVQSYEEIKDEFSGARAAREAAAKKLEETNAMYKKYGYKVEIDPAERSYMRSQEKEKKDANEDFAKTMKHIKKQIEKENADFKKPADWVGEYMGALESTHFTQKIQKQTGKDKTDHEKTLEGLNEEANVLQKETNVRLQKVSDNLSKFSDLIKALTPKDAIDVLESVGGY